MKFDADNIKCGGCANSIRKRLLGIGNIDEVSVDRASGRVEVVTSGDCETPRDELLSELAAMGYPDKGSVDGLGSLEAKAASYVSCAIGRMS